MTNRACSKCLSGLVSPICFLTAHVRLLVSWCGCRDIGKAQIVVALFASPICFPTAMCGDEDMKTLCTGALCYHVFMSSDPKVFEPKSALARQRVRGSMFIGQVMEPKTALKNRRRKPVCTSPDSIARHFPFGCCVAVDIF